MAYRSDEERLRRRVAELERELSEARVRIAALEGRGAGASFSRHLFGTEVDVGAERVTSGTLGWGTTNALDVIATDRQWSAGVVDRSGNQLTWTTGRGNRVIRVSITRGGDALSIRAREDMGNLLATFYGVGMALAVALLAFVAVIGDMAGLPLPMIGASWVALSLIILLGARLFVGAIARARRRSLDDVVEQLSHALREQDAVRVAEPALAEPALAEPALAEPAEPVAQAELEASVSDLPRPRASTGTR